jgi:Autotransporter beta-domain
MSGIVRPGIALRALCVALLLAPASLTAQGVSDADLQKRANAVLTLMGFSLVPDVTTGALSLSDQGAGNPYFRQTSIAGGGTPRKDLPLYLEGTLAYGRYDPTFAVSDGGASASVSVKWNSVMGTGGVGWDFPVARDLVLRPIFNFSLGRVESGSLMLDYERYRPANEIDFELRYSYINLQSFDSSQAVEGHSNAQTFSLWSRYRAPTGLTALERPLRYVLEYAYTRFLGDLDGVLGFHDVNSFGVGLELDSSKYDVYVTRTRLLVRYKIGNNVTGWAVGLGFSF